MAYTVNKLAKLSGVSVRTLHYYDEVGLLKPSYIGDNGYRYYEEAQLLMLQQILFFRELGFPLNDIKRVVSSDDFDKVLTLESHRETLISNLNQTQQLIETIDKTIAYLRGEEEMKLEDIFHGFDAKKQGLYERFLLENGVSEESLNKSKAKVSHWKKADWEAYKVEGDEIYAELVAAIENQLAARSSEVQALMQRHYQMVVKIWTPDKESYIGLSHFYGSHPDFVAFYHDLHPNLLVFLVEAMTDYAEREL